MKVYGLFHRESSYMNDKFCLKIESNKTLQRIEYVNFLNKAGTEIAEYNDVYYLSFSRKALLAKAREIKQQWIDKQKAVLAEIEAIKI